MDYNLAESGNHKLFGRFGKQDDTINESSQFPAQEARRQRLFNNFGLALGYDTVLTPRLTNSFRYGVTRIDEQNAGRTNSNYVTFRFIDPFDAVGSTFTDLREPNTHNFVNDLSWFKGTHGLKAGTNIRFSRVPKERFQTSYLNATVNPSWVAGVGRRNMPGSAFCTVARCSELPAVASAGQAGYADAWLNIIGVLSQSTQRANYDRDGVPQPNGSPVERTIGSDEYEVYFQDSWQVRSNLTITGGVRYSVYSPPYEVNGLQVAPTISMGEWFDQRVQNMQNGIPSNASPIVTFDLAGPANNKPGFYAWDKNNIAPRLAVAWTPTAESGFLHKLTGDGALIVRGGYTKVFDRVGLGLATNFDEGFAFGMSTQISSPFGAPYEENPAVRFVDTKTLPPTVPAAPPGGFPQTPPRRAGIITQSIDDTMITPSAHMLSAVIGRDLGRSYQMEVGYLGRFGRDLLTRRDLAMPLNLVDTKSGSDYFTAAQGIINAAEARGITGNSPASAYTALPNVAYWENLFPAAAGAGLTATQAITRAYMQNGPDWITALYDLDTSCSPACSVFGPYAYFAEQYDSLAAISSIGRSNYHAMLLTLRKRYAGGTQFDINYTLSKSEDMGSQVERGSAFGNFSNGGSSGFLINSFEPELNYGISDFDVRHQINMNGLAELPFGQGKRWASNAGGLRQRHHRRLVGRRTDALDERLPVQRRQLPFLLGHQLEPHRQRHARGSGPAPRNRDGDERGGQPPGPVRKRHRRAHLLPASAARRSGHPQPAARRRLLHDRHQPQQVMVGRHRRPSHPLPLGCLQLDEYAEVRRRPVVGHAGRRRLRQIQRHAGHLRCAGWPLHAVRAQIRVLSTDGGGPLTRVASISCAALKSKSSSADFADSRRLKNHPHRLERGGAGRVRQRQAFWRAAHHICGNLRNLRILDPVDYFSTASPRSSHSAQPPLSALAPGTLRSARSTAALAAVISLAQAQ